MERAIVISVNEGHWDVIGGDDEQSFFDNQREDIRIPHDAELVPFDIVDRGAEWNAPTILRD